MRASKVVLTLLCLWMVFVLAAYGSDESAKEKAAADAAMPWLALVDSGHYGESWFQAASLFRDSLSKEQWTNAVRAARDPLAKWSQGS